MLSDSNTKASDAEGSSLLLNRQFDVFRHIHCIVSNLPEPVLLHTMQIDMLDHLQKWIFHFMKTHEWLDKYNEIWLSVPDYPDLTPKHNSYEDVSRWNKKEMKDIRQYLPEVVTQSLQGGNHTQHAIYNRPMESTWEFLEF